ncbi:YhgE/Pip domain-containing protein [Bacillus norwichensis]|uniref:YhgE/Pip domain-containing protein n=1 Tax=Bacillus norwichensis TaxID=2762217 RepID=A0ABR8VH18_9BACI|nr:YhgE/Pip domain-containing protein [Bacillus norwichensis]MBD8003696.1 YhgE/Pip domain-containing protein [Bacillus norwichensis]
MNRIFTRDLKNISTNWAAVIIIGGLIFLPSLYAWLNIAAMWNPYSHTDQIPVGLVNEDKGAVVRDQSIDAGKELVNELKGNKDLDWHFTNRKKAMEELRNGDYFAVIIVPENFSESLGTVISDHPKKAKIEYYVNEKMNSISPKITQKGASMIVEQVSSKFVGTVNGVIFELFNEIGIELQKDLPDIKQFEQYVFTLEEDLPEINKLINDSLKDASSAGEMINKAQGMIPEARQLTSDGLDTINKTSAFLSDAEKRLQEMAPKINADIQKVQKVTADIKDFLGKVQGQEIDLSKGDQINDQLQSQLTEAIGTLGTIQSALSEAKKLNSTQQNQDVDQNEGESQNNMPQIDQTQIDLAIEKTAQLKNDLQQVQTKAAEINAVLEEKKKEFNETMGSLQQLAGDTSVKIDAFAKEYKENIEPTVMNEISKAMRTLSGAREMLTEIQTSLPEVEKILQRTDKNLGKGTDALEYAHGEFPYVNEKVRELADKIRKLQGETNLNEIIQLLLNDPNAERSFFEEPVQLNENKVFPIKNYGTGMTPFYTVLSIWVGALLLISLLSTDLKKHEDFTGKQIYFGRLFSFWSIGLLQTLIVVCGDLLVLGVPVRHPFWMILFGLFISLVFVGIVYTLVSVFGNIGKALAIVMLVLQIAGSGGTYPVVLLPEFFQIISPLLPFTYAVDLMREATGGIVWQSVIRDLIVLALFGLAAILFGTFLKEPVNRKTRAFLDKSKEVDILH